MNQRLTMAAALSLALLVIAGFLFSSTRPALEVKNFAQDAAHATTPSASISEPVGNSMKETQPAASAALASDFAVDAKNEAGKARQLVPESTQLKPDEKAAWIATLPSREVLRREVAHDVHSHPASLIKAARVFAEMLASSRNDPRAAELNFQKFGACASEDGDQLSTSLKVTCFESAKTLSILNPEHFASRLDLLEQTLNSQTRKLISAYDQL